MKRYNFHQNIINKKTVCNEKNAFFDFDCFCYIQL